MEAVSESQNQAEALLIQRARQRYEASVEALEMGLQQRKHLEEQVRKYEESIQRVQKQIDKDVTVARINLQAEKSRLESELLECEKRHQTQVQANEIAEEINERLKGEIETLQKKRAYEQRISSALSSSNDRLQAKLNSLSTSLPNLPNLRRPSLSASSASAAHMLPPSLKSDDSAASLNLAVPDVMTLKKGISEPIIIDMPPSSINRPSGAPPLYYSQSPTAAAFPMVSTSTSATLAELAPTQTSSQQAAFCPQHYQYSTTISNALPRRYRVTSRSFIQPAENQPESKSKMVSLGSSQDSPDQQQKLENLDCVICEQDTDLRLWRIRREVENTKQTLKEKFGQHRTESKEALSTRMKELDFEIELKKQVSMALETELTKKLEEQRVFYEKQIGEQHTKFQYELNALKALSELKTHHLQQDYLKQLELQIALEKEKWNVENANKLQETASQTADAQAEKIVVQLREQNDELREQLEALARENEVILQRFEDFKKASIMKTMSPLWKFEGASDAEAKTPSATNSDGTPTPTSSHWEGLEGGKEKQELFEVLKRLELEAQVRAESEETTAKLEEKLVEAAIRIEEWKHHFLSETQERAQLEHEKMAMQAEIDALRKRIELLLSSE